MPTLSFGFRSGRSVRRIWCSGNRAVHALVDMVCGTSDEHTICITREMAALLAAGIGT